jgi:hypothetical protein
MTDATLQSSQTPARSAERRLLSDAEALVIGGLGGITPIVVMLLAGEHTNLPDSPLSPESIGYYVGLALRTVLLFSVGAVAVWLHKEVRTRYAAFRLGIAAPALIATMVGSASSQANAAVRYSVSDALLTQHANTPTRAVKFDALPPDIVFGNCTVTDGLLGRKCKK